MSQEWLQQQQQEAGRMQVSSSNSTESSTGSIMNSSDVFYKRDNGFSTEKELVPLPEKEVVPLPEKEVVPLPEKEVALSSLPETCSSSADPSSAAQKEVVEQPEARASRYWSRSRRRCFILAGLSVLLLALALGLGLGLGLAAKRRRSGAPEPRLHALSRVSATNWTDPGGFDHQAVFYQGPSKAILLSLWDSQNETWSAAVNVSRIAANMSGNPAIAIDILPGTALAAASLSLGDYFELNIYYQSSQMFLYELYTHDPLGGAWTLGSPTWAVPTLNGSGLAAYHKPCGPPVPGVCTVDNTTMYVVYQDDDPKRKSSSEHPVRMLNRTGYSWHRGFEIVLPGEPVGGTDVAAVPVATSKNGSAGVAFMFDSAQDSVRLLQAQGLGKNWTQDTIVNDVPTDPPPRIAAMSYGEFAFTETLVGVLDKAGAIATYVSGKKQDLDLGALANQKFSALSLGLNMRAFGIVDDNIAEFSFTSRNPTAWSLVRNVLPG